jgi:rubrerythrin
LSLVIVFFRAVSAELAALRQRRTEARMQAEAEARMIHARAAATARNAAIVAELEAERRHVHASSITQGPHHPQYHVGSSNIFNRKRHHWTCRCGLYQYAGDRPGGSCPANRYHTQPTWEMWQAQAQADGSWRKVLEERGYDFSVDA